MHAGTVPTASRGESRSRVPCPQPPLRDLVAASGALGLRRHPPETHRSKNCAASAQVRRCRDRKAALHKGIGRDGTGGAVYNMRAYTTLDIAAGSHCESPLPRNIHTMVDRRASGGHRPMRDAPLRLLSMS